MAIPGLPRPRGPPNCNARRAGRRLRGETADCVSWREPIRRL